MKAKTKLAGSAKPLTGKCGARLRGKDRGRFCTDELEKDRTRCRAHGGATPREAAGNATKHGGYAKAPLDTQIFTEAFGETDKAIIRQSARDPEEAMKRVFGEVLVVQGRALRAGAIDIYARLTTSLGTIARAIAALHQVPPADPNLPGIEFVYGDKREDFADDMTRQAATR